MGERPNDPLFEPLDPRFLLRLLPLASLALASALTIVHRWVGLDQDLAVWSAGCERVLS